MHIEAGTTVVFANTVVSTWHLCRCGKVGDRSTLPACTATASFTVEVGVLSMITISAAELAMQIVGQQVVSVTVFLRTCVGCNASSTVSVLVCFGKTTDTRPLSDDIRDRRDQ